MFRIKLTARAKKELKNLSRTNQVSIGRILEDLKDEPYLGKGLARELTKRYSYKIGVYRIIYKINKDDGIVYILTVGHRSIIYQ
ncbi:type II toxin-antitoxin system RelE/ParE family toxin [Patescibacteria group bacterium]|nr:type II toxin-antitoxin system RelE/ParE family toxin [Patescibacteria group bacterium]MCL5010275.1 type II toxin-antitoxin system RelE/ParE family toxin [Patescibacteria group bacterium]